MKLNIKGRVSNISLPVSRPLMPLYEAISNSIQAIEERKIKDGRIVIEIEREKSLVSQQENAENDSIIAFIIKDNGVGFNDANYESFNTSDTAYKAKIGGKGIGRFLWLSAFEKVEISSSFKEGKEFRFRQFEFSINDNGVKEIRNDIIRNEKHETVVKLINFQEKYRNRCYKKNETIAISIVEQFLDVFLSDNCPEIELRDSASNIIIKLDDIREQITRKIERKSVMLKGIEFELFLIKLYSNHFSSHEIKFCANERVVLSEKLTGIANLLEKIKDENDEEFIFTVYVNSKILDEAVNSERTGFNIAEDDKTLFGSEVNLNEINKLVINIASDFLKPYTLPVEKKKQERIEKFVNNQGVMYKPLLNKLKNKIDEIKPDANENEMDKVLYQGYHEIQVKLREEGAELIKESLKVKDENWEIFREKFVKYFEEISEANKADLARYVCHRKSIIEFLKKQLAVDATGKYKPEENIHSIIFPMGKTSEEISFEDHNLWLIDERLSFHFFLSSDKTLLKTKTIESQSKKEPDLLIFDKAIAFSDSEIPYTSITIIEFKRPLRKEYNDKENPFVQVQDYIDEIRKGKARKSDGRTFDPMPNLPFYCFVICDLTPQLEKWAKSFSLQKSSDGLGFFGYFPHYNAYIEVISYNKVVSDAEKRNKIFFNKLGLK